MRAKILTFDSIKKMGLRAIASVDAKLCKIEKGACRDVGPRSSLSVYILGLWPKPRTRGCSKRINLYQ